MLFAAVAPLLVACHLSVPPVCERSQPSNIQIGTLQPAFVELLQRSATFRQQCARIAASRVLRVTVRVATTLNEGARAQTIINRYEAGGIRAEVTLRFAEDYLELLAHEFEHVLEQVDRVSLHDEVAKGRAWITPSGAFESRRAFEAGIRAREEYDALAPDAPRAVAFGRPLPISLAGGNAAPGLWRESCSAGVWCVECGDGCAWPSGRWDFRRARMPPR
jgi:hypothetical protein